MKSKHYRSWERSQKVEREKTLIGGSVAPSYSGRNWVKAASRTNTDGLPGRTAPQAPLPGQTPEQPCEAEFNSLQKQLRP